VDHHCRLLRYSIQLKSNKQLASVVKNKLVGKDAFWLEMERRKNVESMF
jgi:hypothetical protein